MSLTSFFEKTPSEGDDQDKGSDPQESSKKDLLRAIVTRIGPEPLLQIEGVGEVRFAYRNVKKKHGEARPFIQVGDNVECRLTRSNPPKAVSVRLVKKGDSEEDKQDDGWLPYDTNTDFSSAFGPTGTESDRFLSFIHAFRNWGPPDKCSKDGTDTDTDDTATSS
ncbi:hypothetical protein DIPPA_28555 [Diplonema papillatum]|nr:hypothetical protein DIPPA_28555 [Diplonema papillatum]